MTPYRRLKNVSVVYACTALTGLSHPTKRKPNFSYIMMYQDYKDKREKHVLSGKKIMERTLLHCNDSMCTHIDQKKWRWKMLQLS